MGDTTAISWADRTMNFWIGCTEVSVGEKGACVGCYAREQAKRYGWAEWGNSPRHRTSEANWRKPFAWDREAAKAIEHWRTNPFALAETPKPSCFVFTNSLADIFDNQVDPQWRRDAFDVIRRTPNLTWLLLTKRPQNIVKLFGDVVGRAEGAFQPNETVADHWPRNAAIGCTVVTQAEADRDVPHLLQAKATLNPAFAFLSMEPLMEAVDLTRLKRPMTQGYGAGYIDALRGWTIGAGHLYREFDAPAKIDWCITGGETDQGKHRARETPDGAFESLLAQCRAADVPFHLKQMTKKRPTPPHLQIQERPVVA